MKGLQWKKLQKGYMIMKKNKLNIKAIIIALSFIFTILLIMRLSVTVFSYKVLPMGIIGTILRALLVCLVLYILASVIIGIFLGLSPLDDNVTQSDFKISFAEMKEDFNNNKALFLFGVITITVFAITISIRIFIRDKMRKK